MIRIRAWNAGNVRKVVMGLMAFGMLAGPAMAGERRPGHRGRVPVDPRRGPFDFIRGGLGPDLLPFTRKGPRILDHRYPSYPAFHAPVPAGPGDSLYETGQFPWQRG
ncbi:hypothetical protein P12x_000087 [Tundrisphaera lichenicola]|uniref:hypothetical protein n=1 Tax=Tundrisphaera lichenicola TaxID=2029860 RepID=UPI003EBE56CD